MRCHAELPRQVTKIEALDVEDEYEPLECIQQSGEAIAAGPTGAVPVNPADTAR